MKPINDEKEHLVKALRAVQLTFIQMVAEDKTVYPKIKPAWQYVSIALAKEAA